MPNQSVIQDHYGDVLVKRGKLAEAIGAWERALAGDGDDIDRPAIEKKIKDDLSVTVRCIPLEKSEPGTCPFTDKPSAQRVVWAKAY